MAEDYRVVGFRRLAPISRVTFTRLSTASLDIRGRDFHDVVDVRINGSRAPEFIVLGPKRLIAEIPARLRKRQLRTVSVLAADARPTERSLITFEAFSSGGMATGRTLMVQYYLSILFMTPGSDIFDPTRGAGLMSVLGTTGTAQDFRSRAVLAVKSAQDQMIDRQTGLPSLTDAERIKKADLVKVEYVAQSAELRIQIRLTAMDGSTSPASLVF